MTALSSTIIVRVALLFLRRVHLFPFVPITRVRFSILFLLLLFAVEQYHAQTKQSRFDYLAIEDGLSQSSVGCIVQDREGYMWFGTEDGLNRYDGYQFTVFRHGPGDSSSLSDNYIYSLCVDQSGVLWVGTKSGLNAWDSERETFIRFPRDREEYRLLSEGECRVIHEDRFGVLWIGTTNGLNRFDPQTKRATIYTYDPKKNGGLKGNHIHAIYEDSGGTLWIGVSEAGIGRGLHKFDRGHGTFTVYETPGNQTAWTIQEDEPGRLWIGTYDAGLLLFDNDKGAFRRFNVESRNGPINNHVWSFLKDRHGEMWIGTGGGGLIRYSDDKKKCITYTLYDNYILSLYEDRANVLWIGTGKGIQKFDRKKDRFRNFSNPAREGSLDREVWSFAEGKNGMMWVGTGNGLSQIDNEGNILRIKELDGHAIYSLYEDNAGVLWIGSQLGLLSWEVKQRKLRSFKYDPYDNHALSDRIIHAIYQDRAGNLWIGTAAGGLNKFDKSTESFTQIKHDPNSKHSLSDDRINSITEDRSGILWIGTNSGGLNRFDPDRGSFVAYVLDAKATNSLSNNRVNCVYEDKTGVLWIGTRGGLNRFEKETEKFTRFTEKDGLPNNVVYGIVEDEEGYLWLSTNKGLARFDPVKKVFRVYDERDGLQSSEFNRGAYYKNRHGEIFFGGINGFNSFFGRQFKDNPYPPQIVFTDFRVFDKSLHPRQLKSFDGTIELAYSENFFSVEFAALDYSCPEKNQYAYKLEGFDKDWVLCGTRRYAAYTNLDAGEYVFRVKGSNNDGIWNKEGATMSIRIIPPYWKTWWFRALSIFVGAAVIIGFVLWRFTLLKHRADAQQEMARLLLESQESERKRIGAGLHDSLGQNLLIIKNLAVMGLEESKKKTSSEAQLEEISTLSSQALAEVREISYDLRPYQLDRLGLTGALRSITSRIAVSSPITFTQDFDNVDSLFPSEQEINVFRIVQEAINNIVKHSRATNAIVQVKRKKETVMVTISDNGIGFADEHRGFGLTSMAERVRILDGSLEVKSRPGQETSIVATIPVKKTQT